MITLWMSNTLHYLSPSSIWLGNTTSAQDVRGTDQWQLMTSNILQAFMKQYIELYLILKAQSFYGLRWSFTVFRSTTFNAQMWLQHTEMGPLENDQKQASITMITLAKNFVSLLWALTINQHKPLALYQSGSAKIVKATNGGQLEV